MVKRNQYASYQATSGIGLNFMSPEELRMIHYASLEVLRNTGLKVNNAEARAMMADAGAWVDEETKIVKFPEYMVEDAITSAPSVLTLYGRDPKNDLLLESKRVHVSTFGQATMILDPHTGELRQSTKQDAAEQALLTDALDNIDICERSLTAWDAPDFSAPLHEAEVLFANTTKHAIFGPGNGLRAQKIIDMAAAVVGGKEKLRQKPILTCNCCPTSPLLLEDDGCTGIMACARSGVPCNIISMVLAGASGPITLAGSMVVHNSEILASLILSQLTVKGAPFICGGSSLFFDLKDMATPVGSPEFALFNAAMPLLAQMYMLPSFCAGG